MSQGVVNIIQREDSVIRRMDYLYIYIYGGSWGSDRSEAAAIWIVQRIWSTLLDLQSFGFGMGLEISLFFEPRTGVRDSWWTSSHSALSGETQIAYLGEALHVFSRSVQSAGVSWAEAENPGATWRNACGIEATWLGSRYCDCRVRSSESLSFSAKPPPCRGRTAAVCCFLISFLMLSCCHWKVERRRTLSFTWKNCVAQLVLTCMIMHDSAGKPFALWLQVWLRFYTPSWCS